MNHDLTVKMNDGSKLIFEWYKEWDMLRCIRKLERAKNLEIDNLAWHKVPVFHEMIVSPLLPEKEEGVRYIVNDMVARCNPDRKISMYHVRKNIN